MLTTELLAGVAKEYGTPCYVYDESAIIANMARFTDLKYQRLSLHFASMANSNPHLLEILRLNGFGIFVNSPMHLEVALRAGFSPETIIYTSTGVRRSDLARLADIGVTVNLDSLNQVRMFGEVNPGGRAGIRLNIGESFLGNAFQGTDSRIGVMPSEFEQILETAAQHAVSITGTHVYLGTDIRNYAKMRDGVRATLELSDAFPDLEYVDLGGGFPVDRASGEDFDYETYNREIDLLFREYSSKRGRPIRLVLEPGRSLFGNAAVFCAGVLDIKARPDRRVVCCDASAAIFPRSMFYDEYHDVYLLGDAQGGNAMPADIVGSTTYSRDYLAKSVQLPDVCVDDILVFQHAGSYCYSMITQFLGQQAPEEVLVRADGSACSIRAREPAVA